MSEALKTGIKTSSREYFNFTGRMNIPDSGIIFDVCEIGDKFRCQVTLRNWVQINKRVTARHLLTLEFGRSGEPVQSIDMGSVAPYMRSGGVITAEIQGGYDPDSLYVKVLISDPDSAFKIVVSGRKRGPDLVDVIKEQGKPVTKVRPLRDAPGSGGNLLYVVESPTSGGWDLKLRGVEMPNLVIDPVIGRERLRRDPVLMLVIECEVFRRVVMELASRDGEYDGEAWADKWKKFAASFSGIGEWSYFADEADDLETLEQRVDYAVESFRARSGYDQALAAYDDDMAETE